jgi:uncharacterized membrane protein YcaP (DUF421 family)
MHSEAMIEDLLSMGIPPGEKVLRTIAVYLAIALILRIAGKRLMAQMNSLDLVVVLLLSNVVQNAVIGDDNSLSGGLLGAAVLIVTNAVLDRLAQVSPAVRWLVEGRGTVLVSHGRVDDGAVAKLGMTQHELNAALRQQGADSATEVARASIEPGGTVRVDLERDHQAASFGELRAAVDELRELIIARDASAGAPGAR